MGCRAKSFPFRKALLWMRWQAAPRLICSMRPGDFTTTGHFIVLVGAEDGKIRVHDPNSTQRSNQLWSWETLEYQIKGLWVFHAL